MKITAVDAHVWEHTLEGTVHPAWSPGRTWNKLSTTIFRVHTDAGITGSSQHRVGRRRAMAAPRLISARDPFYIEQLVRVIRNSGSLWSCMAIACDIEVALWDLLGKVAGLPLYRLWGAQTDRIRAYASLVEMRGPEQRAEDATRLLEQGYTGVKLRLHAETMREDIAQVEAVRAAIGDRMAIMVDANQAANPAHPAAKRASSGDTIGRWRPAVSWPNSMSRGSKNPWGATNTICSPGSPRPLMFRLPVGKTISVCTNFVR